MNYETAFKAMVAGHAVKRGNMVYFIPATAQPTENNIRSIYLEDEPHPPHDITPEDKLKDDWETL